MILADVHVKVLVALVAVLVANGAEARTRSASARARARPRLTATQLRSAIAPQRAAAHGGDRAVALPAAPVPEPASGLRAILPPGLIAALVEAASRRDAPPSSTDGLSWRDLRPQDESGRRILPLAIGRF